MSNRLTFSLASLILMFALGLIFAPMSVMAHDTVPDVDADPATQGNQHGGPTSGTDIPSPAKTVGTHTHDGAPTVESIDLVDVMAYPAGTDNSSDLTMLSKSSTVRGSIVQLVVDVDAAIPAIAAADAAGQFLVKITFSEDVYGGSPTAIPTDSLAATATDLAAAGLTVTAVETGGGADLFGGGTDEISATIVRQLTGQTIPNPDGSGGTLTVVAADATPGDGEIKEDLKVFYVTFEVPAALFTAGAELPIDLWVNVDEDAVYTRTALNAQGETVYGEGNDESDREMFTIKSALEAVTVTATPSATTVDGSTDIVLTLSATTTIPSLMASDFSVMEGTTALTPVWDDEANTLTITPPAGTADTTITVDPSTDGMAKISFTQVSVMVDRTAPMVTIGDPTPAAPMAGDEVTVVVSVDGTAGSTDIDLSEISVTQDVSGTSSVLVHSYDATSGEVKFTPTAASMVTVTVDAGAVMDDVGNSSAVATKDITVTAPAAAVAVTATPAATTVNGSTDIVVTLSATAPAMVPSGLMASDFTVMEGTTALTDGVEWDDEANTLTITPAGTGDTTVTVDPSTAGMAKITFDQVSVMVDRTGPMVTIDTSMVSSPMVGDEVTVTVSADDDASGEIALGDITVMQDANGVQSFLSPIYNAKMGTVKFTPTAAGTVTVTVAADAVMDAVDNGNAETTSTAITVAPAREAVAVMAMAAAATVNGSTDIEVTLSATAPAMVPSDLMASDFSVMEGDTALTPVVGDKDATAGTVKLTITPAGTGDTTVTVDPSAAGMAKISFAQVSVMVDRTGPMVAFSGGTGAKADTAVTVTITVTGAATDEMIAVGDIGVVQTLSDGTAKVLSHTYNTGVVTFTPDAASTVTVTVDANAVMDAVGNGNAETATDPAINVAAADAPPDVTAPTVMVTAGTQSGRTLPVTFTVADETALGTGTDATLEVTTDPTTTEITVTGGTLGMLTASTTTAGAYTADITIDYDVTTVTVAVAAGAVKDSSDNPSAAVSEEFTVTATSAPPAELADGTFKIPAKSYIIIAHDEMSTGLPASITPMTWAAMPDLEALLFGGGTLLLTTDKSTLLDRDDKADTDAVAAKKRDALITEVMAAVNLAKKGQASYTGHQWIELYNNLPVEITVTLRAIKGRETATNPLDAGADEIRLDRLSNQVGSGWTFEGLGQNGYDAGVPETRVDFVSFYRSQRAGDKDGHVKGHWATSTEVYLAGHKGTPGAAERKAATIVKKTELTVGPVIFNEISNRESIDHEWIELRNKSDAEQNMKNRRISIVTAVGSDVTVFDFGDADAKIPAKGVLLLPFTDPSGDPNHPLAAGWNIDKNAANQVNGVGAHSPRYLVLKDAGKRVLNEDFDTANEGLPNNGEFVLILRTRAHGDDVGKDTNIWDIAGFSTKLKVDAATAGFTNLWPLKGNVNEAKITRNKLEKGKVHRRQHENVWGTWSDNGKDDHDDRGAFRDIGWTGIGYKRNASAGGENGGTPGYNHSASQSAGADATGAVIISEVMYDPSRNLPQWIELQNMSNTVGVNVDGWRLFVANHALNADGTDYEGADLSYNIDIKGRIPPGQTYLIVSNGSRHNTQLPNGRIHNLRKGRGAKLLNPNGFYLTLKANAGDLNKPQDHQLADTAGNLAAPDTLTSRRTDAQSFADLAWTLPSGMDDSGNRVSIARRTSAKLIDMGTDEAGWVGSDLDIRTSRLEETYYGHNSDIGSPGTTVGSVLPVGLSKFRPERLDDGSIVIRWITDSELNNAGFNILRSETRDGEFTKLNTKLIAGQGTTSERTTYTYTDPSAKPNVIYYYQIQDVSLDGQVQTLRLSRLKGNVSPDGKLTTTWGELKALQ
ncbi:MAG: lamin tail domain-containing protein [Candidatus Poribacteria bacterium]|nr:lamin tail domain-containing protein [Candidatus Poribacteria bacterium]